eukprot:536519_1
MGNLSNHESLNDANIRVNDSSLLTLKEGYLLKQSAHLKKWKKRYVVLRGQMLLSYTNKLSTELTEIFDLSLYDSIEKTSSNSNEFKIISASKSRLFKASTTAEMLDWIKQISHVQNNSHLIQVNNTNLPTNKDHKINLIDEEKEIKKIDKNKELKTTENKNDEESKLQCILCLCNIPMKKISVGNVYGNDVQIECCWCDQPLTNDDTMYHCNEKDTNKNHCWGYFICCRCSKFINHKSEEEKRGKYNMRILSVIAMKKEARVKRKEQIELIENFIDANKNIHIDDIVYQSKVWIHSTADALVMYFMLYANNCLYIYDNFEDYQRHECSLILDLKQCHKIESNDEYDMYYGFCLNITVDTRDETASKPANILFCFKKNNEKHEWMTHVQYIMNNKKNVGDAKQKEHSNEESINNDVDDDKKNFSFNVLEYAMNTYHEWNENQTDTSSCSISDALHKKYNINYVMLLNYFYDTMSKNKKNNEKIIKYQCKNNDECEYRLRHYRRIHKEYINDNKILMNDNDQILRELLDQIHFYLYHNYNAYDRGHTEKFTINADDEKEDGSNNAAVFVFGRNWFPYYDKECAVYVYEHASLFIELTLNPYCKIEQNKLNQIYLKAMGMKKSNKFQNIKAKHADHEATIDVDDPITINHIIALLTYCNEDELQRTFKKHTRTLTKNETVINLCKRHRYIAHWARYLRESCLFYGDHMKHDDIIYCGINTKLIFDSFSFVNYCPLSTSTDITVANNFATNDGIILKLKPTDELARDTGCRYFDMMLVSNYIAERERFFCGGARLKVVDIIINGNMNENVINALKFLELILNGSLFNYEWNQHLLG